jgi:hypothetical protein
MSRYITKVPTLPQDLYEANVMDTGGPRFQSSQSMGYSSSRYNDPRSTSFSAVTDSARPYAETSRHRNGGGRGRRLDRDSFRRKSSFETERVSSTLQAQPTYPLKSSSKPRSVQHHDPGPMEAVASATLGYVATSLSSGVVKQVGEFCVRNGWQLVRTNRQTQMAIYVWKATKIIAEACAGIKVDELCKRATKNLYDWYIQRRTPPVYRPISAYEQRAGNSVQYSRLVEYGDEYQNSKPARSNRGKSRREYEGESSKEREALRPVVVKTVLRRRAYEDR